MTTTTVAPNQVANSTRGFTKVDNERLEAWAKTFPVKQGIVLLIERMTTGWHRSIWSTTVSELARCLGKRRESVSRALKEMVKAGQVIRRKADGMSLLSLPPIVITTTNEPSHTPYPTLSSQQNLDTEERNKTFLRQDESVKHHGTVIAPQQTSEQRQFQLKTPRDEMVTGQCDRSVTPEEVSSPRTRAFAPSPKEKKKETLSKATAARRSMPVDGAADAGQIKKGGHEQRPELPKYTGTFLKTWQSVLGEVRAPEAQLLMTYSETQLRAALGWLVHRCNTTRVHAPAGLFKTLLKAVRQGEKPLHPFSDTELAHIAGGYHPMLFVPGAKPRASAFVPTTQQATPRRQKSKESQQQSTPPSPTCLLLDLEDDIRRAFGHPFLQEVRQTMLELHAQDADDCANAPMDIIRELVEMLTSDQAQKGQTPSLAVSRARMSLETQEGK